MSSDRRTARLLRVSAAVVCAALLGACANAPSALPRSEPSVASISPPAGTGAPGTVSSSGCPVDERRFCQEASALANAITQASADAVLTLSRPDRIECATADADRYPQCDERDVLKGFGMGTPDGERYLISEANYRDNLGFIVEAVDDEYSDDLGGSAPQILGVSACPSGSYHLVYTVGLGDPDSTQPGARFLGTYEFTQEHREWAVSTAHFGWITDWEIVYDDPLAQIGCGGVRPWATA